MLPLAGQEYQPDAADSHASLVFGERLRLRPRYAPLSVLGETLLYAILMAAAFAVVGVLGSSLVDTAALGMPYFAVFIVAVALMLLAYSFIFALRRRSSRTPAITVDAEGITGRVKRDQKPVTIPWQRITVWAVIPPPLGTNKPTRYIVFGDGWKLVWVEPADARLAGRGIRGDRREAYRALAIRVHALIASRTGLPLRELGTDAVPVGQV